MLNRLCVLLLEDREADAELILHGLRQAGFDPQARRVDNEADFVTALSGDLDVILANYSLPTFDGLRALRLVRKAGLDVPVILVNGALDEETGVHCMREGAADYLLKDRIARLGHSVSSALHRRTLAGTARSFTETLDIKEVADRVAQGLKRLVRAHSSSLRLLGPDGSLVSVAHAGPLGGTFPSGHTLRPGEGLAGRVVVTGRAVWSSDLLSDPRSAPAHRDEVARAGNRALLVVPLRARGRAIGTIAISDDVGRQFTDEEVHLAQTLADQAALALRNAQLFDAAEKGRLQAEQAAEALRVANATFESVIKASPAAITALDREGRVTLWSDAAETIFGWKREDVLGQPLPTVPEDRRAEWRAEYALWLAGEVLNHHEVQRQRKDGTLIDINFSSASLRDSAGRVVGRIAITVDVTERKRLEAELRQAQKMEAVGRLAGGIAHDFNNLLTVISGRSFLLRMRLADDARASRDLELVAKTAERAAMLTRQILAFSRRQVLRLRVFDVAAIVSDLERMLRRLIGEDIELQTRHESADVRVKADPTQLEQVVMNLVLNARDAMPRGGQLTIETSAVELTDEWVHRHPGGRAGPHVQVAVSDTGTGIADDIRSRIFEPFFTTKPPGHGTGLGLSTVYGIVKQHNGYITVESTIGEGAVFRVYLPRVAEPVEPAKLEVEGYARGSERILLVEDDDEVRGIVREMLESFGYAVLEAANGPEAIALFDSQSDAVDLLITDVVMPGMGGAELGRHLRLRRSNLKVLYVSGHTDDTTVRHGVAQAPETFVDKPFTIETLCQKVRQVLDDDARPM